MPENENTVWLVYDGECPICTPAANAFSIKQAVGDLRILKARDKHPVIDEITKRGLNLDQGMVLIMNGNYYHGAEALHICSLIGTHSGIFNSLNVTIFRSKFLSKLAYPFFRGIKDIALCIKGAPKINNLGK